MDKLCKKCNTIKDVSQFDSDPRLKDGYKNECHACRQKREQRNYRIKRGVPENKYCPICDTTKDWHSFNLESQNEDGLAALCRDCGKNKDLITQSKAKLLYKCIKCSISKNGENFPTAKNTYTCLYPVCKECLSKYRHDHGLYKKWANDLKIKKINDPEFAELLLKKDKERHYRNPINRMLTQAKGRAKKKGLSFNLDKDDIVVPEICPILKIPFIHGKKNDYEYSPSLDRKDNTLGYVKGNVQIITKKANSMKNSATPEELLLMADWIYETFGHLKELKTA